MRFFFWNEEKSKNRVLIFNTLTPHYKSDLQIFTINIYFDFEQKVFLLYNVIILRCQSMSKKKTFSLTTIYNHCTWKNHEGWSVFSSSATSSATSFNSSCCSLAASFLSWYLMHARLIPTTIKMASTTGIGNSTPQAM